MWNKNIYCAIFGIILVAVVDVRGQATSSLTCYSCTSAANCAAVPTVTDLPPITCSATDTECVIVFDATHAVTFRGCASAPSSTAICPQFPANCHKCSTSNCNVATQMEQLISCKQCNSYTTRDCVWNPTSTALPTVQCDQNCVVALVPKSDEDNTTLETYRGCLSGLPGISKCDNTANCWTCNQTGCNTFNEPSTRLTCNYCTDTACTAVASQPCLSYRPNDKCVYVLKNDSTISTLGCASRFNPSTIPYMIGMGTLVECDGVNCNTLANAPHVNTTAVSCVSCSSDTDPLCATNPSDVNTTVECGELNKLCITDITATGSTVRGCLAAQSQTVFLDCYLGANATYCSTCNTTNCNNQVFPANRLSCYQCNSENDKTCESNPTNSTICPTYKVNETCIQYKSNNTMYRGCSSQLSCDNNKQCTSCSESGCNNKNGSAAIQITGFLLIASLFIALFSVNSLK